MEIAIIPPYGVKTESGGLAMKMECVCASGVTGADLRKRIEAMVRRRSFAKSDGR